MSNTEVYNLYKGKVTLTFDPVSHVYEANGRQVYGVTNIIGVIDKPALKQWAANTGADKFKALVVPGRSLDEIDIATIYDEIRFAYTKVSKQALDIGTLVHEKIEEIINAYVEGKEIPALPTHIGAKLAVQSFLDWVEKQNVKFLYSERKIFSKTHKYAGTVDIIAEIDGEFAVLDIKTSKAIYDEYFYQTAAYSKAIEEEFEREVKRNIILRVDKTGKGIEVKENGPIDDCFNVFLACKTIYEYQMQQKNLNNLKLNFK